MIKYVAILLLGTLVSGLPQRPIILTEYRSGPTPINNNNRPGSPPAAPTPVAKNTRPSPAVVGTFNDPKNTNLRQNPNAYNPDGHNLTFIITARDLPNTDLLDNIDPYIKVYTTNKTNPEPFRIGSTETIKDSVNAEFLTVFSSLWKKGQGQKWVLRIKDKDTLRDKSVAEAIIDVDDYVVKGEKVNVTLKDAEGKPVNGTLLVQKTSPIKFQLYARNLPHSDPLNGKSDPFVRCYWKRGETGEAVKFYETKVQNDLENVDWNETIEFANYIKGTDLWLVFKVLDSDSTGEDELGEAQIQVDPYVEKRQTKIVGLVKGSKKEKLQATLGITPV